MISFLVAMDKNRVIGKDNGLPWHLPADLKYFKQVTMGHPIIMGRKTYESIGRPLPGRENIILTRNQEYKAEGCTIIHTIEELIELEENRKVECFVIGGAEIFNLSFSIADRIYITEIDEVFEGDTHFPEINMKEWELVSKEKGPKDDKNPYDYYFCVYDRVR
ncbi:dihydrofolate reductase [Peribacillus deserti]|uniref:Dihydrofolate reductase n=1 Tax=Peribacillus deserti TaxID=673318 RepID=A0A2N5M4N5_9BACI|nr:dihydrofolate reductase [Peribacillus deserti]PLT29324.1 dihydrofolate reductase [Peribacillus deserti]